jgi:hypothetical protein
MTFFPSRYVNRAMREGWYIDYGCAGARVRAIKGGHFKTDCAAAAYVMGRAATGDELACQAVLALIEDNEVNEFVRNGAPQVGPDVLDTACGGKQEQYAKR